MSVRLVLLGLLKRKPQYGYELKAQIEKEMGDWTSIAFGSIYFALKKLTEEGFVEQTGAEQHGNRPSRIIYKITYSGEKELKRLIVSLWEDQSRTYFPLDIGLYFLDELDKDTQLNLVKKKRKEAGHALKYVKDHEITTIKTNQISEISKQIFSHSICHIEAEYKWLCKLEEVIMDS
ncbi:MAG: PadR family transcriptional regulator [Spirochaetales bacterium]|nr:PadR family transcriptional regulator [Spirochaetales bacterium]